MKLAIAATPKVAIPTINELLRSHEITLITQPDSPSGRGKRLKSTEVSLAYTNVLKPESEAELQNILVGKDLLLTIGFGRILKKETLSIPKFGGINLHFSLLPLWRGAAPVQRSIEAGDKVTGVTVFQMDEGMDTGPIWCQIPFDIPYGFSSKDLFDALENIGVGAVKNSLELIAAGKSPTPQKGNPTIARKIEKNECVINWNTSAENIVRKIKAFSQNPGVSTQIRGTQIKVTEAHLGSQNLAIGELSRNGEVGAASGSVKLMNVIPAGRREMSVSEWLNGFKLQPGEKFE